MKRLLLFSLLALLFINTYSYAQLPVSQELRLIEDAVHIPNPSDIREELQTIKDQDSITLILFSKKEGVLMGHHKMTKSMLLSELKSTGFKNRYFVALIRKKAIFYLNEDE